MTPEHEQAMRDQGDPVGELPADLRDAVARLGASEHVLVASDFDGVLAPLVLDPMSARPLPGTIEALRRLAALEGVTVALASGRDLATLRQLTGVTPNDGIVLIGSHGAESSEHLSDGSSTPSTGLGEAEQAALERATAALEGIAERVSGARVEHKPAGVVLHTRGMDDEDAARATKAALAVPRDVAGVRGMRGKSVVELSVLDVSKGSALAALAATRGATAVMYFGDDVTDETVFEMLHSERGDVGVKVGDGDTAARFRLVVCELMPALLDAVVASASESR